MYDWYFTIYVNFKIMDFIIKIILLILIYLYNLTLIFLEFKKKLLKPYYILHNSNNK